MDITTRRIGMHPRIDTEGLERFPFQAPSDPFSADPKRHQSVSSSSSWDIKCCGDQTAMMPHPVSQQGRDVMSTTTTHSYFPTVAPDMLMLDEFNPTMIAQDSRRGPVTSARSSMVAHAPGDFHLPPYGYHASTPCRQKSARSNCSTFSDNDHLDIILEMDGAASFDFGAPRTCPDLSSPTTTAYTSSSNERTPLMVLLSQQFSEPSTPRSAASYSHSRILESSHSSTGETSPFMSPMTLSIPDSENRLNDGKSSRAGLTLTSPSPLRSSRTKARRSQCTRHRGKYCDKECGKLCKLPKIYSKEDNGHKCPECNQRFKRQEHLKRHARVHTKERPFTCKVEDCKKQFSRSDNFKDHMRTHAKVGGRNTYVPGLRV